MMKAVLRLVVFAAITIATISVNAAKYVSQPEKGLLYQWDESDVIGLFNSTGTSNIRLFVKDSNENTAILTTGGWLLTSGNTYYCYAPFSVYCYQNSKPMTALSISYVNQKQIGNDNTGHISAYDYRTTQGVASEDGITFEFNHLGCVLRLETILPRTMTVTKLLLKEYDGENSIFVAEADMNATNNLVTPTSFTTQMSLDMQDVHVEEGEPLIAYMMALPQNLSGKILQLDIIGEEEDVVSVMLNGTNLRAGYCYSATMNGGMKDNESVEKESKGMTVLPVTLSATVQFPKAHASDFLNDSENVLTPYVLYGDVNYDGEITMEDCNLVIDYYLGLTTESINTEAADFNRDGVITVADANGIMHMLLNK